MSYTYSGPSIAATGSIADNTASALVLAKACRRGCLTNLSGQRVYIKIDDSPTAPTVSPTNFDLKREDGEIFTWDDQIIKTIGVYVHATSGVYVSGWPG